MSTVLYYRSGTLAHRDIVPTPVDLQYCIETYAETSNPALWDWRNFKGLVVMRCREYDETFIVYIKTPYPFGTMGLCKKCLEKILQYLTKEVQ